MPDTRLIYEGMPDLLPMQGRTPGIHVSEVIHELCVAFRDFDDKVELTTTWAQLGCALEDAVVDRYKRHFPGRYIRPGELERDNIYGTPDLLDTRDWVVEEIKLSWMSCNHGPDSQKFWRYWVQVAAYCWMVKTDVARLHVCHVNGDWKALRGRTVLGKAKSGLGPVYRVYERRFTLEELKENWHMLRSHAEVMRQRQR
jgi:hypothetical protein